MADLSSGFFDSIIQENVEFLTNELESLGVKFSRENFHAVSSLGVNHNYSDCENVYLKVYLNERSYRAYIDLNVSMLMDTVVPTLVPLVSHVIELPDGSLATVWPWVDIQPIESRHANDVLEIIRQIHTVPAPDFAKPRDLQKMTDLIEERLNNTEVPRFAALRGAATHALKEINEFSSDKEFIFSHGDLHAQNFGVVSDRVIVFDWELTALAPVEWDGAMITAAPYWSDGHQISLDELEGDNEGIRKCALLRMLSQIARHVLAENYVSADEMLEAYNRMLAQ